MTALALATILVMAAPADPAQAERSYAAARRLAADRSPGAAEALRAVAALDPDGPWADDALLDLARVLGAPDRPEAVGRLETGARDRAREALDRALAIPGADRAAEARLLRGLLALEPLPGRDPAAARADLAAVAADARAGRLAAEARLALGALELWEGRPARARAAWQRLRVDAPGADATVHARLGVARILLAEGAAGRAAALLQEGSLDPALRDLAVRTALRAAGTGGGWGAPVPAAETGVRNPGGMVRLPGGDLVIADLRGGQVLRFDPSGAPAGRWALEDVQALAVEPSGIALAAAGEGLYRLLPGGPTPVGALGRFAPVSALAVDAAGRIWVVDRKGGRLGRLDRDGGGPVLAWESEDVRLAGLVPAGLGLAALDERGKAVLDLSPEGIPRPRTAPDKLPRPLQLAGDAAGSVAVLDGRIDEVLLVDRDGEIRDRRNLEEAGIQKPAALALGPDGGLDVLDAATGRVTRFP